MGASSRNANPVANVIYHVNRPYMALIAQYAVWTAILARYSIPLVQGSHFP